MTTRRDDTVVLVAIAFALITTSACGAGWAAAGWREGLSRAALAVFVAGGALKLDSPSGVAGVYLIGGVVAMLARAFVIVPMLDGTVMPDLMGPSPGVRQELAATFADPAQALWWSSFDLAMLVPVAVLLGEARQAKPGAMYLLVGGWLAAIAALDVLLTTKSDHGLLPCIAAVVGAFAAIRIGLDNRSRAAAALPWRAIVLPVIALAASVLLWVAIQHTWYCAGDRFGLECALHT